jgi:protein involved in polysaccharide export with SLBB domain
MTLRDLVLLAGGLTEAAYLREAEVARLPEDRDGRATATTLRVPLDSSYRFELASAARASGGSADVVLAPYDNVLIMRDPAWRKPRTVWLTGEVRFPGPYTLVSPAERLSEVIARAGGLTEIANPHAAYLSRLTDSTIAERARARRMLRIFRDTAAVRADSIALEADTTQPAARVMTAADSLRERLLGRADTAEGPVHRMRVGIDLRSALRGRGDDIPLEDGDSLHVPHRTQVVEVRGAVNQPSATAHVGAGLGHYVRAAGGPSERARTRHVYVIQPGGRIETRRHFLWFIPLDPEPLPGAIVVVPERMEPVPTVNNTAQYIAMAAQLLGTLATIIYLTK